MLTFFLVVQILLTVLGPIGVAVWMNRGLKLPWGLFFGGALAYVAAWVVSNFIPLPGETGVLFAAVAQMGMLYLIYRFQLQDARTEREALMVGAGQGGTELVLIGLLFLSLPLLQMSGLRDATDARLTSLIAQTDGVSEDQVAPERLEEVRDLIADYWGRPWYVPLVQAVQSLALIPIQIALAVIVLSACVHGRWRLLVGAMALHFLSRLLPMYAGWYGGIFFWLALTLLFSGVALWFLTRLWPTVRAQTRLALKSHQAG